MSASVVLSVSSAAAADPHPPACPGTRPVISIGGSDKAAQNVIFLTKQTISMPIMPRSRGKALIDPILKEGATLSPDFLNYIYGS